MRFVREEKEGQDEWRLLDDDEMPGDKPVLLPLARWLETAPAQGMHCHGLWVRPDDDLEQVLAAARRSPLVAVEFPNFNDGRGYSIARRLRMAGYAGELRAVGDILRDQAFYLARCGFTSFAPAAHVSGAAFIAGLKDFSFAYQGAADQRSIIQRLRHA